MSYDLQKYSSYFTISLDIISHIISHILSCLTLDLGPCSENWYHGHLTLTNITPVSGRNVLEQHLTICSVNFSFTVSILGWVFF